MLMKLLFISVLLIVSINVFPQGCSDAGFCTMGALKPDQHFEKKVQFKLRSMELNFYRGTTTATPVIYMVISDFNFSFNAKSSLQFKVPYTFVQNGNLGETQGIGDVSLCYTRSLMTTDHFDLNFSFGSKIPTNRSDLTSNKFPGEPLPMYYQTSLGTLDLMTGISLVNKKWLIATGIQVPILHINRNGFDGSDFQEYPDPEYLTNYSPSNLVRRGIDVMFRVERNIHFSRLNFSIGLLPIYRITNDRITDENGKEVKPHGANGLALSEMITVGYHFNVRSGIKLIWPTKLVTREVNPDGLTRPAVFCVIYNYRF